MKIALVVLVHNQAANLRRLIPAYQALVRQPDLFVFVCDRCTDDSVDFLDVPWTTVPVCIVSTVATGPEFRAGRNRDIGAEAAEHELGPCNVVFLDGDCVPAPDLLAGYAAVFDAAGDYPAVVVGRRVNESADGSTSAEDNRRVLPGARDSVFTSGVHRLVVARDPVFARLATWSCNLGLNSAAIALQRQVNALIDQMSLIFNDGFYGRWGGEDDFVGLVAAYLGMAIVGLDPDSCYVRHIHHLSRENSEYLHTMQRRSGQLKHLATRLRFPGVCFAQARTSINVNEAARQAITNNPGPVLSHVFTQLGISNTSVYWQALAAHTAVTGPLTSKVLPHVELGVFRAELERIRTTAIDAVATLQNLRYTYTLPEEDACNICGSHAGYEADGRCRGCMSKPWNRMAAALTRGRTGLVTNPELTGEKLAFDGWTSTNYSVDKTDLTALPFDDESFNTVVSTHVLEHIRDDRAAMAEIARVLRPGGFAVLAFPTKPGGTAEDLSDTLTPQERRSKFYWHDHFRVYGMSDVLSRLRAGGLSATAVFAADLGVPGCAADDVVFQCTKDVYEAPTPTRLYLDVFNGCNYACSSCNIHAGSDAGGVDTEVYKTAMREFADLGGRQVHFQSGETWLRKTVVAELAQAARALGLEAHLVTNGSAFKDEDTRLLCEFTCVAISVDSHDPAEHDAARGVQGAYNAAMRAQSIASRVTKTIATQVMTQARVAHFPAYVKAMLQAGFDAVGFNVVEPDFAAGVLNGAPFYQANKITDVEGFGRMLDACMAQFSGRLAFTRDDIAHVVSSLLGTPGCGASASTILLNRDMSIRLCAHKPAVGTFSPGALARVWTGARARDRRDQDQSCARPCATGNCNRM